jgi:N-acetylglucosamine-6-phosphate deacetylase
VRPLILRGRVVTPLEEIEDGWVLVERGLVASMGRGRPDVAGEEIGGPDHVIAPGFIDLQVNGYAGRDAAEGAGAMEEMSRHLPRTGVTAFLPTVITGPLDQMLAACDAARSATGAGARVLGAHLEGPFLNPLKRGAHDASSMIGPSEEAVEKMAAARPRMVTLAPEIAGACHAVRALTGAGALVSAGHSTATFEEAHRGFDAGISFATHLFNAMPPWAHREPGLPGAVLTTRRVTAGLIADGVHVHRAGLEAAIRLKGASGIALTTDMVAAAGAPAGRYRLGSLDLISDGAKVQLGDGTLAGGASTMDGLVRVAAGLPGVGERQAIEMATLTPARVIGEPRLGRIATGLPADLVMLDAELRVRLTLVQGEEMCRT